MQKRQAPLKRRVSWTIDAELATWIQSLPGTESEAAERIIRRAMEAERAALQRLRADRENVEGLLALLDGAPAQPAKQPIGGNH